MHDREFGTLVSLDRHRTAYLHVCNARGGKRRYAWKNTGIARRRAAVSVHEGMDGDRERQKERRHPAAERAFYPVPRSRSLYTAAWASRNAQAPLVRQRQPGGEPESCRQALNRGVVASRSAPFRQTRGSPYRGLPCHGMQFPIPSCEQQVRMLREIRTQDTCPSARRG